MKKKPWIILSSIVAALVLLCGVVYALFRVDANSDVTLEFGDIRPGVTATLGGTAVFGAPGDTATISICVAYGEASTVPFGYEFSIVPDADAYDADLAASVLAYLDGELLGTASAVFPNGTAFEGNAFVRNPDRLIASASDNATHELKLEYHVGAASFHKAKSMKLNVSLRASSVDPNEASFANGTYFSTLMRDAEAGRLPDGHRIVLTENIVDSTAYTVSTPLRIDLNGYTLDAPVTFADGTTEVFSRVRRGASDPEFRSFSVNGTTAFVNVESPVKAGGVSVAACDANAAEAAIAESARAALRNGISSGEAVDFAGGNDFYLTSGAVAAALSELTGGTLSGGTLTAPTASSSTNGILAIGGEEILFDVYGTDAASAAVSNLDAIMNAQLASPVQGDILLPRALKASLGTVVRWTSSDPSIITSAGKFLGGEEDLTIELVASVRVNGTETARSYTATLPSASKDRETVFREILAAYGDIYFVDLDQFRYLPSYRTDRGDYADLGDAAEQSKMMTVDSLVSQAKTNRDPLLGLTYSAGLIGSVLDLDPVSTASGGTVSNDTTKTDKLTLVKTSAEHTVTLNVTGWFGGDGSSLIAGTVAGAITVHIDIMTGDEAWDYVSALTELRSNIEENILSDRYHSIDYDTGADQTSQELTFSPYHGQTLNNGLVREGSFALPKEYQGFRFVYLLQPPYGGTLSGAMRLGAVPKKSGVEITKLADRYTSAEFAFVQPDYNNCMVVNPAMFDAAEKSDIVQVGVYRKSASGDYVREGSVHEFGVKIPAAIHNDAFGFGDAAIFNRVYEEVQAISRDYLYGADGIKVDHAWSWTACPDDPKDTVLASALAQVETLALRQSEVGQADHSFAGIQYFVNMTDLTLAGTADESAHTVTASFFATPEGATEAAPYLSSLTNLESLDMQAAGVGALSAIRNFKNLSVLNLSYNPLITQADDLILNAGKLKKIDLRYTGLNFSADSNGAVSTFDMLYYSYRITAEDRASGEFPSATFPSDYGAIIRYSYGSGSSATEVRYEPKNTTISENTRKAMRYAMMVEVSSQAHNTLALQESIFGASDVRIMWASKDTNRVKIYAGTNQFSTPTLSAGGIWSAGPTQTPWLAKASTAGETVLQLIVVLRSGNSDIANAYFVRDYTVNFLAVV